MEQGAIYMKLKGKVALVTGGSRGIGKDVCIAYAAEGAKVVVNYNSNSDSAMEVVDLIQSRGGEAIALQCNVGNEQEVLSMINKINEKWDGIDILVNNAAIYPRKVWHEISGEEWDNVLSVNLKSCFLTAKAVFPYMSQQQYGKIINVSSVTFHKGQKQFLHYVSSKGGIIGFTRALAREVGKQGICVNCITPGAVSTEQERLDHSLDELKELADYLAEEQCFSRRQLPADIVGGFVFLASSDSDFITGQTLNIDGGWMMH